MGEDASMSHMKEMAQHLHTRALMGTPQHRTKARAPREYILGKRSILGHLMALRALLTSHRETTKPCHL